VTKRKNWRCVSRGVATYILDLNTLRPHTAVFLWEEPTVPVEWEMGWVRRWTADFLVHILVTTLTTNFPVHILVTTLTTNFLVHILVLTLTTNFPVHILVTTLTTNFSVHILVMTLTTNFPVHILVTTLTTNSFWGSREMKRAEHRVGWLSCNWALYCDSHTFWCYFCSKPSLPTLNMFGAVFIDTFATVYKIMLHDISEYPSGLELFLHLLHVSLMWCWNLYKLWLVWVIHIFSSYHEVNTSCLGYRNKSVNAVWESKNKMH
jgi:hypothetical protein